MTIILDQYATPTTERLEIHASVEIRVSAERAKKMINHWLLHRVSSSFGAGEPVLVVGEQAVWRVPVRIGFSRHGFAELGTIDVDVQAGDFQTPESLITALQQRASEIIEQLPPFQPRLAEEVWSPVKSFDTAWVMLNALAADREPTLA